MSRQTEGQTHTTSPNKNIHMPSIPHVLVQHFYGLTETFPTNWMDGGISWYIQELQTSRPRVWSVFVSHPRPPILSLEDGLSDSWDRRSFRASPSPRQGDQGPRLYYSEHLQGHQCISVEAIELLSPIVWICKKVFSRELLISILSSISKGSWRRWTLLFLITWSISMFSRGSPLRGVQINRGTTNWLARGEGSPSLCIMAKYWHLWTSHTGVQKFHLRTKLKT